MPFVAPAADELAQLVVPALAPVARVAARCATSKPASRCRVADGEPLDVAARGGDRIQALRKARARVTLALAVGGSSYAGVPRTRRRASRRSRAPRHASARSGGLLLGLVLVRGWDELLPWALLVLAAPTPSRSSSRGAEVDEARRSSRPASCSAASSRRGRSTSGIAIAAERAVVASRAVAVGLPVLAGLAVSALVLALAAAPVGGGLAWTPRSAQRRAPCSRSAGALRSCAGRLTRRPLHFPAPAGAFV